jgi:hypothetical protein
MAGDDEEPEIEVAAAPASAFQQPKRRARTPNPAVDDHIATGEISPEPRSRIVRSSPSLPTFDMAKVQVREEPTEPVVPRPPMATPMPMPTKRGRPVVLLVAGGLVLGVAAGALILAKSGKKSEGAAQTPTAAKPDDHTVSNASLQAAALLIGTTLDGDAHGAMVRAEAIASSSMLRAGIQTDAKTLADMAKDNDVAFPIKQGETVEVFQLRDGQRVSLLRLPAGAPEIASPGVGKMQLANSGGVLTVVVNAAIAPGQGSKISGEIVLTAPIDLEAIRKKVTMPSTIVGLGSPIVVVGGAPGGNKQTVKIDTEMKAPISLEAVP